MSTKPRVLLLNPTCLDVVDAHGDWIAGLPIDLVVDQSFRKLDDRGLRSLLAEADGVIYPASLPIRAEQMREAPRLRVISCAASGYDSLDVAAATSLGVVVTNVTVQEGAEVVADLAWGLMLAVARQIPQHDRQIRAGDFRRGLGTSPWRKTLGIVGLGNIGRAVARRAVGFDMRILATEIYPDVDFVARYAIELMPLSSLLGQSDFVSLHLRLNDSTRDIVGYEELKQMKSDAFLVNTARRELVRESDLVRALDEGLLAGAGLDDPPADAHTPLLTRDNVVFTTHIGNRARVGVEAVFRAAVENAIAVLSGNECPNAINPEAHRKRASQP